MSFLSIPSAAASPMPRRATAARRIAAVAALATFAVALSGCSFFQKEAAGYKLSPEQRPLEIPPDLDIPGNSAAMQAPAEPQSVTRSSMARGAATTGFTVAADQKQTFDRLGQVLATVEGLEIASRAELLGVYDVHYGQSDFLLRVTQVEGGSYVSAVDPRGQAVGSEDALKLVALLKDALSQ